MHADLMRNCPARGIMTKRTTMPTYNFECEDCGHTFALARPMSQAGDPARCPKDNASAHRLYNANAVRRSGFRENHPQRNDPDLRAELAQTADDRADAAGAPRPPPQPEIPSRAPR